MIFLLACGSCRRLGIAPFGIGVSDGLALEWFGRALGRLVS